MRPEDTLMTAEALDAVRAVRISELEEARDRAHAVLTLFDIPSKAIGQYQLNFRDVDERDGPLMQTLMALLDRRFPLHDASAADAPGVTDIRDP